jgi:hypothetical protein
MSRNQNSGPSGTSQVGALQIFVSKGHIRKLAKIPSSGPAPGSSANSCKILQEISAKQLLTSHSFIYYIMSNHNNDFLT